MRKLAILTFISLDGVMQAPKLKEEDTSNNFDLGGWADPFWDDVMTQVGEEAMAKQYDLLLGRHTYELFAQHNAKGDIENPLNRYTKYVVTNSLTNLKWENSIRVSGNIIKSVEQLKNQPGPLLQVHGSWQLVNTLLKYELVDELRLWTFPVVLGKGKRLFDEVGQSKKFKLIKSKTTDNGVVMSIYRK